MEGLCTGMCPQKKKSLTDVVDPADSSAHLAATKNLSPCRGENFLGRLGTLRALLGREGAQAAVRKAPYLLLEENQRLVLKWPVAVSLV